MIYTRPYRLSGKLEITYPIIGNHLKVAGLSIILRALICQGEVVINL